MLFRNSLEINGNMFLHFGDVLHMFYVYVVFFEEVLAKRVIKELTTNLIKKIFPLTLYCKNLKMLCCTVLKNDIIINQKHVCNYVRNASTLINT